MSRRTVAIVQARMTSSRLPGKVLLPLAGAPLLARVLARVRAIAGIDAVCVAAPEGEAHDVLEPVVASCPGVAMARGPEDDVLARTYLAARQLDADVVVRVTSDCPFLDPAVSSAVVAMAAATGVPFAATAMERGYPTGMDTEVATMEALGEAYRSARDPYEREHVTAYLWRRPDRFAAVYLDREPNLRHWRLVVDTPADYALAREIYADLSPREANFGLSHIIDLFARRPELLAINAGVRQTPYQHLAAHG